MSEKDKVAGSVATLAIPDGLHLRTALMVISFAGALATKLLKAQQKYGYTDGWARDDWEGEWRQHLHQHIAKGDPLDVAAYAAFGWHHGWSTVGNDDFFTELNNLCAEFGALGGQLRIPWLRSQLQELKQRRANEATTSDGITLEGEKVVYQYAASVNTAHGTVQWDGVVFGSEIKGIDDYHQIRSVIAQDGHVPQERVNVISLSAVGILPAHDKD